MGFMNKEDLHFVYYPNRTHGSWLPYSKKEYAMEYRDDWKRHYGDALVLSWDQAVDLKGISFMDHVYNEATTLGLIQNRTLYQCTGSECSKKGHYDTCIEKYKK
jgi:hypothetical protein